MDGKFFHVPRGNFVLQRVVAIDYFSAHPQSTVTYSLFISFE